MPRPRNSVPSYLHHKPSGQAAIKITLSGGERKTVYLGVFGSEESKAEYARRIQALSLNTPTNAPDLASPDVTVAEILVGFLAHAARHYRHPDGRPTSEVWAFKMAVKPLRELFAHLPAREFGPAALKTLRAKMIDLKWCRKSVNKSITRIRSIFRWAVSEELIPGEVLQRLASVSGLQRGRSTASESEPVAPVSDPHIQAVLQHVRRGVRGLIRFQRLTGARPGEALNLRLADLDRSGPVWSFTPAAHKNAWRGKARTIAIGPRCQELLGEYATSNPNALLFPTAKGVAYTVSGYRQAVERACERAGIPVWTPNQIRHAVATEVRRVFGLEGAQVALGHSRADVTQVYAERDSALAARVASKLG